MYRLIIGNKLEDIENGLLPNGPQIPPKRIQEVGSPSVFRTTYKGGKLLQGTPSKSFFESGGIEPNQCRHAAMSTILGSPLCVFMTSSSFSRESVLYGIVRSSVPNFPFHLGHVPAHGRILAYGMED